MSKSTGISPDFSSYSINDLEAIFTAASAASLFANLVICQPRSSEQATGEDSPAAAFIDQNVIRPCDRTLVDLARYLKGKRFANASDEERRVRLYLRCELQAGVDSIDNLIAAARVIPRVQQAA